MILLFTNTYNVPQNNNNGAYVRDFSEPGQRA